MLQLSLGFHGADWWGRRRRGRSIHTGVSTAIKTAQSIVWAISVSLSRTPAVGDDTSTFFLRTSIWRCGTLSNISTITSSTCCRTKGSLYTSIEAGSSRTVNIEPPVTHKHFHVEDSSVGTKEGDRGQ